MTDTMNTLSDALAGFGISLIERTRLTFGAPTLKMLKEVPVGTGKVFVVCKGGESLLSLTDKISDDAKKSVRIVNASDTEYSKVRPHVANFAKSRKVAVTISTMKNADGDAVAFSIARTK